MSCCLSSVVGTRSDGPGKAETYCYGGQTGDSGVSTDDSPFYTQVEFAYFDHKTQLLSITFPFRISLECLTMVFY